MKNPHMGVRNSAVVSGVAGVIQDNQEHEHDRVIMCKPTINRGRYYRRVFCAIYLVRCNFPDVPDFFSCKRNAKTDAIVNTTLQSFISKLFEEKNRLKILSYRHGENGIFCFLFVVYFIC